MFAAVVISFQALADEPATMHTDRLVIEVESEEFARRGDGVVTQATFDDYLSRLPSHHRPAFLSDPVRIGKTLDNLMMPRQLVQQAQDSGFSDDPALQAKLYQAAVVVIADEYLNHLWRQERLDDYSAQARELYMTRPDLVRPPTEVDFVHIIVRSEQERGELDAMQRILNIYDLLAEEEQTLEELAPEYSDDPMVEENGGRYEGVALDSLDQEVSAYLRFLEPGQISEPFRSSHGWHIVRLDRRERPDVDRYDVVEDRALRVAESHHRQQVRDRHLASLFSDPLELAPGAVEKLLERYEASDADVEKLINEIRKNSGDRG